MLRGKFELVKALGADQVIDYNQTDFRKNGKRYEIIFDTVGDFSFSDVEDSLTPRGELHLVSGNLMELINSAWVNLTNSKKVVSGPVKGGAQVLSAIMQMIEEKEFVPVLDRPFKIEQIAEAHAYIEKRHRKGNVAIRIQN